MKTTRSFFNQIKNLSIRYKLFLTFLGLVTVPILLLLVVNLQVTSWQSEQQGKYSMNQVMNQTASALDYKTESINNLLNILSMNPLLQDFSQKSKSFYETNMGQWMIDSQKLETALYFTLENPSVSSSALHFYMREGLASTGANDEYRLLSSVEGMPWYEKFASNGYTIYWSNISQIEPEKRLNYLCAIKGIPSSQSLREIVGFIRLDVPISEFKTTIDQSLFTKAASAFLVNSKNVVLYMSGSRPIDAGEIATLAASASQGRQSVDIGHEKYMLGAQAIKYSDWRLVLAVPYKDILASNINTRNQTIFIFLIIAPLTLPLALLVTYSATKRIRKLISHMKQAEHGNFDSTMPPGNSDEIGQLTQSFNYMLARMEGLMEDKFKLGREMKSLEIRALQAQINPHFLYNTLDLINWMSIRNNAPEIGRLVEALGRFYKLSLSQGEDIVSIGSELEHVKTYVQIQNMRFENNIKLSIDFPKELLGYSIVKIILQPIVENAILHGILEKEDEAGTISILGCMVDNIIRIDVRDDGIGMNSDRIQEILSGESTLEPHGYGVHNINERLRLIYGPEYGLSFISEQGEYTIATVQIPALRFAHHS